MLHWPSRAHIQALLPMLKFIEENRDEGDHDAWDVLISVFPDEDQPWVRVRLTNRCLREMGVKVLDYPLGF